ncbi:phage tail family protein [Lactococcus lactis]|nr:phage tail family protein [Lactococcus lactis]
MPNRYQAGSVMELDMENGKITKDGISSNNELVTGSEFISLPSGETELDIYQSSWNTTPPQIEIQWKERYL